MIPVLARLLLLSSILCPLSSALGAVPLEGESWGGSLVAIDGNWRLTFETDGRQKTMPAADLLRWGRCGEIKHGPVVVLADGGLLRADVVEFDGRAFSIESAMFANVRLPRELVAGVVYELPVDRQDADRLLDWAADRAENTKETAAETPVPKKPGRIRLLNGDELAGRITSIGEENVRIETETDPTAAHPMAIGLTHVAAVRFAKSGQAKRAKRGHSTLSNKSRVPPLRMWTGMADGSLLLAESMRLEAGKLRLRVAGNTATPAGDWLARGEDLVFLQPIGPKATYLSDLTAAEYRHVPYLELPWPYATDRNVTLGRLRCGGRLFIKGLGVHSSARLTYLLERPFARFKAAGGIDDSTGPAGSVRFRVYVDGRKKYASQIVRGGDRPLPISVDIRGAKRLDLIVDFGDRADQQDHADWLDARLIIAE